MLAGWEYQRLEQFWQNLTKDSGLYSSFIPCQSIEIPSITFEISISANCKRQKGTPIYGLSYDPRRQQILVVGNRFAQLHHLKTPEDVGLSTTSHGSTNINDVILRKFVSAKAHTDIVSCVSSYDGRFVSAG